MKKGTKNYKFRLSPYESYELLKQIKLIIKEHRRIVAIEIQEHSKSGYGINTHSENFEEYKRKSENLKEKFYN